MEDILYLSASIVLLLLAGVSAFLTHYLNLRYRQLTALSKTPIPVSVNYHFSRKCNKVCKFCFHTEKSSHVATEAQMKEGLRLLKDAGMKKINFAGGEPFLYPKELAMLVKYCKENLKLESISIISNGTLIKKQWLQQHGQYVDILGVSCDSFDEETNIKIGRGTGRNVEQLFQIRDWCNELGIKFKLNTVVLTYNWEEDMVSTIEKLQPARWKVFQVLPVEGENDSDDFETEKRKRNVKDLLITEQQFQSFCDRHKQLPCFVPETNELMASSYLILDEFLCFLDKGHGAVRQSSCILDVGVEQALTEIKFDEEAFINCGGLYDWSKDSQSCGSSLPSELEF